MAMQAEASNNESLLEIEVVRFYIVSEGGPPQGLSTLYDIRQDLVNINALPLSFDDSTETRYQHGRNGKSLHTIVDESRGAAEEICFRLCEVNREDLPQTEKEGIVNDLPLEEGEGLLESSYGVVFRPGLIGVISSTGPNMNRLARYISAKCGIEKGLLQVVPLIATDVVDRMMNLDTISLFRFKISPSQFPIIRGTWDNLDEALQAQLAVWNEQTMLEVLVRPTRDSQRNARDTMIDSLIALARPELRSMLDQRSVYKIRGRSGGQARDVMLDVLSDSLTAEEEVMKIKPRHSALDTDSAYSAIKRAYYTLESDIETAIQHNNFRDINR